MKMQTFRGLAMAVWCAVFVRAVEATTLAEFMGPYESDLAQWALVFALLGGAIRTILSWQGETRIVMAIAKENAWTLLKAAVAGMAAFFLVQALRSAGWAIPSEVRVGCVLLAGWHGTDALTWMQRFVLARLEAVGQKQDAKPLDPPKDTP